MNNPFCYIKKNFIVQQGDYAQDYSLFSNVVREF